MPASAIIRFWTTRDAELRLEAGYLADPEERYAEFFGGDVPFTLESLDEVPCVVLLGEPGSGKTSALLDEVARWEAAEADGRPDSGALLHVDLRDYDDVADLRARVFEHAEVSRFRSGTHRLTLTIDSLDEALIEMRKLATRLASELGQLPVERLRIRIACRTADWPPALERGLAELWGDGGARVVEIAPLRRRDVQEIATDRLSTGSAGKFMESISAQDAEPFAAKPGTLGFLISAFEAEGILPQSQVELYTIGCRALCEESNESRISARRTGKLSPDQRIAVASRVAAAMIFGRRSAVWTGPDSGAVPLSDLRRSDLVGAEATPGGEIAVDEALLRDEVLSTGLFSARGPGRLGWAHQTYGEFLAALWVHRRGLTDDQVLALLTMSDGIGRKVVPQLHETAAWLAAVRPGVFEAIMVLEPTVLLRSDVARAEPAVRERLVAALLDAAERNVLPQSEPGELRRYRRLDHLGLGQQLGAVIEDRARPFRVRDLALDIAIGCNCRDVAQVAANLALDMTAPARLRALAARAVVAIDDDDVKTRLRPLALTSEARDGTDAIKGYALKATWRAIPPRDLFQALSATKAPDHLGSYADFLYELAESLTDDHVAPGLQWLDQLGDTTTASEQRLEVALVLRAFDLLHDPDVCRGLVRLMRRAIRRYQPLLEDRDDRSVLSAKLADTENRHTLLAALVDSVVGTAVAPRTDHSERGVRVSTPLLVVHEELSFYSLADYGYVTRDDFGFALEALAAVEDGPLAEAQRLAWGNLASQMVDFGCADHTNAVLERGEVPAVRHAFCQYLGAVELGGPSAEVARRREAETQAMRRRIASWQDTGGQEEEADTQHETPAPSAARLAEALRTEADPARPSDLHRARWVNVFLELVRDKDGHSRSQGHVGDPRSGISWRDADADVRAEVVRAAAEFIRVAAPPELRPDVGVHNQGYAWAGYVALRLIAAEAPDHLATLGPEVWTRWAPTVALAEPYATERAEQDAHHALARVVRSAAPGAFDGSVLEAVDYALSTDRWRIPERAIRAFATMDLGRAILARGLEALARDVEEDTRDEATSQRTFRSDDVVAPASTDEAAAAFEREQLRAARRQRREAYVSLFVVLLQGGSAEARAALVEILRDPESFVAIDLATVLAERAFIAACALLLGAEDMGWDVISRIVDANPAFAKELFLRAVRDPDDSDPPTDRYQRLGERRAGELFAALLRVFPYEEERLSTGHIILGPRYYVSRWRDSLREALESWGTDEAIMALQRAQALFPQYDGLGRSVTRAREAQGRSAWRPAEPGHLFAIAEKQDRRLVRDGDELLDLVVESLRRYERYLQGDVPAVGALWIPSGSSGKQKPRDEAFLADDIARHLRRDLTSRAIAANLEVVLRRGEANRAAGLRTDILVTATIASERGRGRTDGEVATLVIEVKGSWHREVRTAMQTQLVGDYMREHANACHGVYVVGDFTCDTWMDSERSRRSKALGGRVALQAQLDAQATELSQGGVRVRAVVLDASLPDGRRGRGRGL